MDRPIIESASKEELMRRFNISLIVRRSFVIQHLRYPFEVMEVIYQGKEEENNVTSSNNS
jgi:hypothetical protein